jgi:penicillin-binding protein 1C
VFAPLPKGLLSRKPWTSLRLEDRNGSLLHELRSSADGRGVPLENDEVPPQVRQAFVASEDQRFFRHVGVDPLAMGRAFWQDLRARRVVSGASTIPQQLARMLVPRPRTLLGKLSEALWAMRLCAHLSRERVLLEYLNRVSLGNSLFGVEAASHFYFDRPAAHLSLGQAALLAGLARGPDSGDPFRHRGVAIDRQRQVLSRMRSLGFISEEEERVARSTALDLVLPDRVMGAPHLVTALEAELPALGLQNAARIQTTLDPELQADVVSLVRTELAGLADKRVGQAAVLVLDNPSGEVLAYVGSSDYFNEPRQGANDGVRSLRQPGSALKPFAYGLALARGHTPAEALSDIETHLATPSGDYTPRNYDRRVHGPVRLRAALQNSYNVPAVRLAEELGPEHVLELLRRAGFDTLTQDASHYGDGIVLGDGDVNLYELARAYRGLALGGVLKPLTRIRAAFDAEGRPLPIPQELTPHRFLPAPAVALLTDILSDTGARAPAFGLDNALRLPFPVAAKTGTSRAYVDNWTVGFTRERTVAVWVGNFDGTPMQGVSGITGAGPLFKRVMVRAMRGIEPEPLVDRSRFSEVDICPLSGKRAGTACPSVLHEVFLPGTEPRETCSMHKWSHDCEGGHCDAQMREHSRILDVGAEFYTWAQGEGLNEARAEAPALGDGSGLRWLSPNDGDEYMLEPDIPDADQTIPVRVWAPSSPGKLEVHTDDGKVLALGPSLSTRVVARPGKHRLELWSRGKTDERLAVVHYLVH